MQASVASCSLHEKKAGFDSIQLTQAADTQIHTVDKRVADTLVADILAADTLVADTYGTQTLVGDTPAADSLIANKKWGQNAVAHRKIQLPGNSGHGSRKRWQLC